MAQYTVTGAALADTYIDSSNPYVNYASSTNLYLRSALPYMAIFVRFNMPVIPARKKIVSARLVIYKNNTTSLPVGVHASRCANTPDIENITYMYSPYTTSSGDPHTALPLTPGVVNVNATLSVIQAYADGWNTFLISHNDVSDETYSFNSYEATSNKPSISVTYEDVPPEAPVPLDPIGAYKDNSNAIRLAWRYISSVGGTQSKFDLQWSSDGLNWNTISQTTSNNYYDIAAGTFPAGNIYWRVRCYNEYDEVSPYSSVSAFYAIGAPGTPSILPVQSNTARPTIEWTVSGQQVYQVQISQGGNVVYDSGSVPGILARSHKVTTFLGDGQYLAKTRIKNEYDIWSAWGEAAFSVATVKPVKPVLSIQNSAYGFDLRVSNITGAAYALLYRSEYSLNNYICVAKILPSAPEYQDNAVISGREYKYFARAVTTAEGYADSDIKFSQAQFRNALVAPVSNLSDIFVFNRSLNGPPKRTYDRNPGIETVIYSGRTYPVSEPTEHISAGLSLQFFLKMYADVERFIALYDCKETVLYRDAHGRKMYGSLNGLSINEELFGYMVSFTVSQVDYAEELEV